MTIKSFEDARDAHNTITDEIIMIGANSSQYMFNVLRGVDFDDEALAPFLAGHLDESNPEAMLAEAERINSMAQRLSNMALCIRREAQARL